MPRNSKKKKKAAAAAAAPVAEEGSAEYFKFQGNARFAAGEFSAAAEQYSLAIDVLEGSRPEGGDAAAAAELDEGLMKVHSNRSAAYLSAGDGERALADADRAVLLGEGWAKAYFRRGEALRALGRLDDAKAAFGDGLQRDPENGDLRRSLASLGEQLVALRIEEEERSADHPDMEDYRAMVSWLREGGAEFPLLYIKRYSETYRGVHARRAIPETTQILKIPRKFLITVEHGKDCPIGRLMEAKGADLTARKHCYLSVFGLWDMKTNANSYFQPYYKVLPRSYENMPIFWSDEELAELQGSYLATQALERRENIDADYQEILRTAEEFADIATLEEFKWARMMVASRNFGVTIGSQKTDALVPYADMLNHKRPRETRWTFDNAQESFTITSVGDIGIGAEVMDSYGKKCNSRFLLNYGFAVEDNRDPDGHNHNEVRFLLELERTDPLFSQKIAVSGGDSAWSARVSMQHSDANSKECWSYLRFICAAGVEIMSLPDVSEDDGVDLQTQPIEPLSCATEKKVLRLLRAKSEELLGTYATTLAEDVVALQGDRYAPFSNARNAVVLRKGEKEVLHFLIDLADTALPLLDLSWKDAKRLINKSYNGTDALSKYITRVVAPLIKRSGAQAGDGPAG